jgi:hypothetical protein
VLHATDRQTVSLELKILFLVMCRSLLGKAPLAHCVHLCSVRQGRKVVRAGVDSLAVRVTIFLFFELLVLNVKLFHNPNTHFSASVVFCKVFLQED